MVVVTRQRRNQPFSPSYAICQIEWILLISIVLNLPSDKTLPKLLGKPPTKYKNTLAPLFETKINV